jgi:phosphoenolpyruvate phosphomutase / 2-hydroxyethylphosphonate cytidylyltransferase
MNIYLPCSGDLFHIGHLRAIRQCFQKGDVYIGLLSDEIIQAYKGTPIIPFKERKEILEAIPEVTKVVKQDSLSPNLKGMDYLASGDGFEDSEIEAMLKYKCKPLKIRYCATQSTTKIKKKIIDNNANIRIVV